MEAVTGNKLVKLRSYAERLAALLAARVGLWDVIRLAERTGSLDVNIRRAKANTLEDFAKALPALKVIGFNGAKASEIGRGQLGSHSNFDLITLPSSSPARAIPFERKQVAWMQFNPYLTVGNLTVGADIVGQ